MAGVIVEEVTLFCCLGSKVGIQDGWCKEDIKTRVMLVKTFLPEEMLILNIDLETRKILSKIYVWTTAVYEHESRQQGQWKKITKCVLEEIVES